MLYTRPSFTCPAAGAKTSGENWDRAFLTHEEFVAKYGESPDGQARPVSLEPYGTDSR